MEGVALLGGHFWEGSGVVGDLRMRMCIVLMGP